MNVRLDIVVAVVSRFTVSHAPLFIIEDCAQFPAESAEPVRMRYWDRGKRVPRGCL